MAKNTHTAKNVTHSAVESFIQCGLASQESKAKAESKGSDAYSFALLASHDKETQSHARS